MKRPWSLVLLGFVLAGMSFLAYILRGVLAPYAVGLALAYIGIPMVSFVERHAPFPKSLDSSRRGVSIGLVYVVGFVLFAGFIVYLVGVVGSSFSIVMTSSSEYVAAGIATLQDWTDGLRQKFSPSIVVRIDSVVSDAGETIASSFRAALVRGISGPETVSLVLGFVSLPLFLFYILKDHEKLATSFYSLLPAGTVRPAKGVLSIIGDIMGRYIRAQVTLGLIVGAMTFVGLMVLGIPFAPALGAVAAVTEMIPVLGPWLGGAVAVIVTLATAPEKVLFVALLALGVQVVENIFICPRIQAGYLKIHPALVIMLLPIGAQLGGVLGMIVVVPFAATLLEIYKFALRKKPEAGHEK